MKNNRKTNQHFSRTWGVKVRPTIAQEFTYNKKFFDENLAGLHEIRARLAEKGYPAKQTVQLTLLNTPSAYFAKQII